MFGILGMVAIILNVPGIFTVMFQMVSVLRIERFAILFLPILTVAMGVGIYILMRYLVALGLSPRRVGAVMIVLIALYGISALGFIREDPGYIRYSFNQAEVIGFHHILEKVPSGSLLHTDYYTLRFFGRKKISESEHLRLPYYTGRLIPDDPNCSWGSGYVILLEAQLRGGGLLFGDEEAMDETKFDPGKGLQPYLPTEECPEPYYRLSTEDRIYSNSASIYHSAMTEQEDTTGISDRICVRSGTEELVCTSWQRHAILPPDPGEPPALHSILS